MHESIVYVVRVWPASSEGFRATVRRVDREDAQLFTEPEALVRFISMPTGPADMRDTDSTQPGDSR